MRFFLAKPKRPEIKGNLTTLVDTYLKLTCISQSTSTPDYYSKFRSLSYTWYINDIKIKGEFEEAKRLNVTRGHRYNRYSCTATEEDLESDRSNAVHINLLCKYSFFSNCTYIILLYGYLKVFMNKYSSLFEYVHYPISSISFDNRWTRTAHFHTKANIW